MSKSIQISLWLAQAFRWLLPILFLLFFIFLACILLETDFTSSYVFELSNDPDIFKLYECKDCEEDGTRFFAHKLSYGVLLWFSLQLFVVLFCLFVITNEIISILRNFKDLKTFYADNIRSFRKMGQYGLAIAAILALRIVFYDNPDTGYSFSSVRLKLPFAEIAFSLACFVLADVFEEGKKLKEDSESIL